MHRSGTSVVAGMLTDLGVFLDPALPPPLEGRAVPMPSADQRRSGYGESVAFRLINEALLAVGDAAWDRPEPFLAKRGDARFDRACLRALRRGALGRLQAGFLAPLRESLCVAWAWNDPRTSLTLPYWLQALPRARVVHVMRNPASVSRSLLARAAFWAAHPPPRPTLGARLRRAGAHPGLALRRIAARLGAAAPAPGASNPRMDDARARALWEIYVAECREWGPKAGAYLELRFEQVVENPAAAACALAEFASLDASPERVALAAGFVERGPTALPQATDEPTLAQRAPRTVARRGSESRGAPLRLRR